MRGSFGTCASTLQLNGQVAMKMTRNVLANRVVFVALALLGGALVSAHACDTWVALADSTANHSIILAKNSDRPPMEAQVLVQFPHERHRPGEMVRGIYQS
jgi:heme A synthase